MTLAIIEETGLALKTPWQELARHLSNLRTMVSYRYDVPRQREREAEERKAFSKLQKLVTSFSEELQTTSVPDSPLSRALSKAAFLAETAKVQQSLSLSRLIEFIDSEPVVTADQQLKDDINDAHTVLARLARYTNQNFRKVPAIKSVARWNTIYVGEVLPALFEHHFGRPFRVSKHPEKGDLRGPGVRFLSATAGAIGILGPNGEPYSASRLVGYWKSAKDNPLQDDDWANFAFHHS
ncbi:hypothetical protein [Microvirga arabica]|uniref:hypothetical protein n=1 Tax=Microvirga arabica TaxID=1128671 RepID=UPI001AEF1BF2|nr:hypothetical protein [Microvirga arabica]